MQVRNHYWLAGKWFAATVGGFSLGQVIAALLTFRVDWPRSYWTVSFLPVVAFSGLVGTFVGVLQALVLQNDCRHIRFWTFATILGSVIGAASCCQIVHAELEEIGKFLEGFRGSGTSVQIWPASPKYVGYLFGFLVGAAQYCCMLRKVAHSIWWPPIMSLSWGISYSGWSYTPNLWTGITVGAATSLAWLWLLRAINSATPSAVRTAPAHRCCRVPG